MKKIIKKIEPETPEVSKTLISKTSESLGREDLNDLAKKVNEIIDFINK